MSNLIIFKLPWIEAPAPPEDWCCGPLAEWDILSAGEDSESGGTGANRGKVWLATLNPQQHLKIIKKKYYLHQLTKVLCMSSSSSFWLLRVESLNFSQAITWLHSQQPSTRGHVEHISIYNFTKEKTLRTHIRHLVPTSIQLTWEYSTWLLMDDDWFDQNFVAN